MGLCMNDGPIVTAHSTESFPKVLRLLRRQDFRNTERRGTRRVTRHLVVIAKPNGFDFSRLGTTVSRKVGNAVVRNRWKRRLRELFRRNHASFPAGFDFVVIVRKVTDEREPVFDELRDELLRVMTQAAERALPSKGDARV